MTLRILLTHPRPTHPILDATGLAPRLLSHGYRAKAQRHFPPETRDQGHQTQAAQQHCICLRLRNRADRRNHAERGYFQIEIVAGIQVIYRIFSWGAGFTIKSKMTWIFFFCVQKMIAVGIGLTDEFSRQIQRARNIKSRPWKSLKP